MGFPHGITYTPQRKLRCTLIKHALESKLRNVQSICCGNFTWTQKNYDITQLCFTGLETRVTCVFPYSLRPVPVQIHCCIYSERYYTVVQVVALWLPQFQGKLSGTLSTKLSSAIKHKQSDGTTWHCYKNASWYGWIILRSFCFSRRSISWSVLRFTFALKIRIYMKSWLFCQFGVWRSWSCWILLCAIYLGDWVLELMLYIWGELNVFSLVSFVSREDRDVWPDNCFSRSKPCLVRFVSSLWPEKLEFIYYCSCLEKFELSTTVRVSRSLSLFTTVRVSRSSSYLLRFVSREARIIH